MGAWTVDEVELEWGGQAGGRSERELRQACGMGPRDRALSTHLFSGEALEAVIGDTSPNSDFPAGLPQAAGCLGRVGRFADVPPGASVVPITPLIGPALCLTQQCLVCHLPSCLGCLLGALHSVLEAVPLAGTGRMCTHQRCLRKALPGYGQGTSSGWGCLRADAFEMSHSW